LARLWGGGRAWSKKNSKRRVLAKDYRFRGCQPERGEGGGWEKGEVRREARNGTVRSVMEMLGEERERGEIPG